jgi:hypothetical protein
VLTKIVKILGVALVAQGLIQTTPVRSAEEVGAKSNLEPVLANVTSSKESIKWIDPVILKKLQEIKPSKSKGYTTEDVLALFPRKQATVAVFLDGIAVDRVYTSNASVQVENIFGKGTSVTGFDLTQPVYVFEGRHTKPVNLSGGPHGKSKMYYNAQEILVSDVNGALLFKNTIYQ